MSKLASQFRRTGRTSSKAILEAAARSQVTDATIVCTRKGSLSVITAMPTATRAHLNAIITQLEAAVRDARWRRDVTFMRSGKLRPGEKGGLAANMRG